MYMSALVYVLKKNVAVESIMPDYYSGWLCCFLCVVSFKLFKHCKTLDIHSNGVYSADYVCQKRA